MRVIIAGSRYITSFDLETAIKDSGFTITEVVSGRDAYGIDHLGELWAESHGVPVKPFPAAWGTYGVSAGPRRNDQMARYAAGLLAIWDGRTNRCGTWSMIKLAASWKLKIVIVTTCDTPEVRQILDDFEKQGWQRTPTGIRNWKE